MPRSLSENDNNLLYYGLFSVSYEENNNQFYSISSSHDCHTSTALEKSMMNYFYLNIQIFCQSKHPKKIYQLCRREVLKVIRLTDFDLIQAIWDVPRGTRDWIGNNLINSKKLLFLLYCASEFDFYPWSGIIFSMYQYEPNDIDDVIKDTEKFIFQGWGENVTK